MNMNLYSLHDIDISKGVEADLFIGTSSPESRANRISEFQNHTSQPSWNILITDTDPKKPSRHHEVTVKQEDLKRRLSDWIDDNENLSLMIYLDISCMSHSVMACVARTIFSAAEKRQITLTVGYVIADFTAPPVDLPPNEDIKPIDDYFAGWPSNASATTSLILGLGYEREKAEGACEYFDASDTWVFFPQSPIGDYDSAVQENNLALLDRLVRKNRALRYQVNSPASTFGQLAGLVTSISSRSNPVILPFGPKIFFMLSLLISAIYREVGIWHITGDSLPANQTQSASNCLIGFQAKIGPSQDTP
jgi:hypothetical protein